MSIIIITQCLLRCQYKINCPKLTIDTDLSVDPVPYTHHSNHPGLMLCQCFRMFIDAHFPTWNLYFDGTQVHGSCGFGGSYCVHAPDKTLCTIYMTHDIPD